MTDSHSITQSRTQGFFRAIWIARLVWWEYLSKAFLECMILLKWNCYIGLSIKGNIDSNDDSNLKCISSAYQSLLQNFVHKLCSKTKKNTLVLSWCLRLQVSAPLYFACKKRIRDKVQQAKGKQWLKLRW